MLGVLWIRAPRLYLPTYGALGSHDFIQYWSAGRLLLQGGNPYDPAALLKLEQAAGWPGVEALIMWNPPWTLALALPAALLPFGPATLAWLALQLALLLGCGVALWRFLAPGDQRTWIGLVLAGAFVPAQSSLQLGQISLWLLVGVAGFLVAQRSRRDWLAGVLLALLMIKPHVTYLFWLSALWWAVRYRRPGVLAGWLLALAAGSGVAVAFSPGVFGYYWAAAASPPMDWATPTLGAWLRLAVGSEHAWVQFLPALVCGIGLLVWLLRRRAPWKWEELAAPLLLVSVATAAYGWTFDQVVLLPAVVDLVSRLRLAPRARKVAVLGALGFFELALMLQHRMQPNMFFDVWHPVALAGLYWWTVGFERRQGKEAIQSGAAAPVAR